MKTYLNNMEETKKAGSSLSLINTQSEKKKLFPIINLLKGAFRIISDSGIKIPIRSVSKLQFHL
jgi:hypothetical protein